MLQWANDERLDLLGDKQERLLQLNIVKFERSVNSIKPRREKKAAPNGSQWSEIPITLSRDTGQKTEVKREHKATVKYDCI